MVRPKHLWLSDGDEVFVYSMETDGTIGMDALDTVFKTKDELLKWCNDEFDRRYGVMRRQITVFKLKLEFLGEEEIGEPDPLDPHSKPDWPRD